MNQVLDDAGVPWLYETTSDGRARFVLGTVGERPLVCFGINPSTAAPGALDRTVSRVERVALANGFDSFVMLNVYPQRSTDPRGMHAVADPWLAAENVRLIGEFVAQRPLTLWAAWGRNITRRTYLPSLLRDILELPALANSTWTARGPLTKGDHPRHPLYVSLATPFAAVNLDHYR